MLLLFHSPGKQEASVWLALLRPSNAIPLVMAAPIVRRISLCAWMINGPGLSICLRDGENQRGLLSSGTRWGTPGAWHRTLPTAWPGPQPALAAAGGGGLAPCEWGRSPLPQQWPRCTPRARHWMYITAASRSVQFLKCCIILLCLTKPNAGGEQASRVLQAQLVEIHLPLRRHTALTPSHVLSFISQFPLQSPSREAVCAALGTRGMISEKQTRCW